MAEKIAQNRKAYLMIYEKYVKIFLVFLKKILPPAHPACPTPAFPEVPRKWTKNFCELFSSPKRKQF
jgi:hypothetical protein